MQSTSATNVAVEPRQPSAQRTGGTFFGVARHAFAPVELGLDGSSRVGPNARTDAVHVTGHR